MLTHASPLLAAKGFDIVDGVVIDYMYMHVVCLGITRGLLEKWLTCRDEAYFIGSKVCCNHVNLLWCYKYTSI